LSDDDAPLKIGAANGVTEMATAHAKQHDYHLVDPSPWPIVGSFAAFIMAVGAVSWMHHLYAAAPIVFGIGVIGVLYTMASWWSDVIREAEHKGDHTRVVQISHRYGMILFIASEVMFFVAWFWAFFSSSLFPAPVEWVDGAVQHITDTATAAHWPMKGIEVLDPFGFPLLNTFILLCSGTTVTWAHHALIHGDREGLKKGLWCTILLGLLFSSIQAYEYIHAPFDFKGNIYGATFFMATGFHGFHVIVGTIFLSVCLLRAYQGDFTPKQHFGFEAAAWYWHFVDVVWLFLFVSIYVWGGWGAPIHG
jgi:cytochrome c oxidase subunit 3